MPLMDDKTRNAVREALADLSGPAKLLMFTQTFECNYCQETRRLVEEVADLSEQVTVEVHNFVTDGEVAKAHNIDKIPAIAVLAADDKDHGIRFYVNFFR